MNTTNNIFNPMCSFENANISFRQAAKNRRFTDEVLAFSLDQEANLIRACEELTTLEYRPGDYTIFKVWEPKERLVMALPFYDRVVQHMIVNYIEPPFERKFYYHSYACRPNKGMHKASDTLYRWMYETMVLQGRRMYAIKGDISGYFANIPHEPLKAEIRKTISDKKVLFLLDRIIDHNGILPDGTGNPVGNLTSQLFANVYGHRLDMFIKHVLKADNYERYMDDFVILSDNLEQLREWFKRIEEFLIEEMFLRLNPKSTILYAGNGIDFCGYVHFPTFRKVRKASVRRLKDTLADYKAGTIDDDYFIKTLQSRNGHIKHADTWHIRKSIEYDLLFYEYEKQIKTGQNYTPKNIILTV